VEKFPEFTAWQFAEKRKKKNGLLHLIYFYPKIIKSKQKNSKI